MNFERARGRGTLGSNSRGSNTGRGDSRGPGEERLRKGGRGRGVEGGRGSASGEFSNPPKGRGSGNITSRSSTSVSAAEGPIKFQINWFRMQISFKKIYRYSLTVEEFTNLKTIPPNLESKVMSLVHNHLSTIPQLKSKVYNDGKRMIFSTQKINKEVIAKPIVVQEDHDKTRKRKQELRMFSCIITSSGQLDIPQKPSYSNMSYDTFQALETIIRHNVSHITLSGVVFDYSNPYQVPRCQIPCIGYRGWKSGIKATKDGLACNLDIVSKFFFQSCSLSSLLEKVNKSAFSRLSASPIPAIACNTLNEVIKGLIVELVHLKQRKKKILGLVPMSSIQYKFTHKDKFVNVALYYKSTYNITLSKPNLALLQIEPEDKKIYIPVELCQISCTNESVFIDNKEKSRYCLMHPVVRREMINALVNKPTEYSLIKNMSDSGMKFSAEMIQVTGRRLAVPVIVYRNRVQTYHVPGGRIANRFLEPPSINNWLLIGPSSKTTRAYLNTIMDSITSVGGYATTPNTVAFPLQNAISTLKRMLSEISSNVQVVVIIIPNISSLNEAACSDIYGAIKVMCDVSLGIPSQVVLESTLDSVKFAWPNILLKLNAKIGNAAYEPVNITRFMSQVMTDESSIQVFGIDVTHPTNREGSFPSIFSVVGSYDLHCTKYAAISKTLPPCTESVANVLKEPFKNLLKKYFSSNQSRKPVHIVILRDGVSEGQFEMCRKEEVPAVKAACVELEAGYRPNMLFICAQKRHRTRFFTTDPSHHDGTKVSEANIPPPVVLDSTSEVVDDSEFFLQAQFGNIGTSKPTHYKIIENTSNIQVQSIQKFVLALCHASFRCASPLSIPAPTYYAHLAAFRARVHLINADSFSRIKQLPESSDVENRKKMDKLVETHQKLPPMYFM